MFELKPLTKDALPAAVEKAQRYRLLNEPVEAESICLDVLGVDPGHQDALITLLLALTDQFQEDSSALPKAREVVSRLKGEYERAYYSGLISERRAKAQLAHGAPGSERVAHEWFREAMGWFEKAEGLRPHGNDDAILRWNTCARILMRNPHLAPPADEPYELPLE
jgi:hypothetical protein